MHASEVIHIFSSLNVTLETPALSVTSRIIASCNWWRRLRRKVTGESPHDTLSLRAWNTWISELEASKANNNSMIVPLTIYQLTVSPFPFTPSQTISLISSRGFGYQERRRGVLCKKVCMFSSSLAVPPNCHFNKYENLISRILKSPPADSAKSYLHAKSQIDYDSQKEPTFSHLIRTNDFLCAGEVYFP